MCRIFLLIILSSFATLAAQEDGETPSQSDPRNKTKQTEISPGESVKSSESVPIFHFGGDFRFREAYQENRETLNSDPPEADWLRQRYRLRGKLRFNPTRNLSFNSRLVWEFRNYDNSGERSGPDWSYGVFDLMNLTWDQAFGLPLTITAGRQEIKPGSEWLIYDGTPGDGSRDIFFDALRAEWDLSRFESRLDLAIIKQAAKTGKHLPNLGGGEDDYLVEENHEGAILYFSNSSLEKTRLNAYFIFNKSTAVTREGWSGRSRTYGGKITVDPVPDWTTLLEAAIQKGGRNQRKISGVGGIAEISYHPPFLLRNSLNLGLNFFSGDNPSTGEDEAFDVLWGRHQYWSKIYPSLMEMEGGRRGQYQNTRRFYLEWSSKMKQRLHLKSSYSLLFAGHNDPGQTYVPTLTSGQGKFRGHLWISRLDFQVSKQIQGHILAERFHPSDYYSESHQDPATVIRFELSFLW